MYRIKDLAILNLDTALIPIVNFVSARFGLDIITSALRPENRYGVHGQTPLRGIDLRCRDETIAAYIANEVNLRWQYDRDRRSKECALAHKAHLHLQVHPNTKRRKEE